MGLSIRSLNNATLVKTPNCVKCIYEYSDQLSSKNRHRKFDVIRPNHSYPTQTGDLVDGVYEGDFSNITTYPAWSYTGYGIFRDNIAKAAGYESAEFVFGLDGGLLWELIKFSNCEGVLCNDACVKIDKDLAFVNEHLLDRIDLANLVLLKAVFKDAAENNGIVIWG